MTSIATAIDERLDLCPGFESVGGCVSPRLKWLDRGLDPRTVIALESSLSKAGSFHRGGMGGLHRCGKHRREHMWGVWNRPYNEDEQANYIA